MLVWVLLGIIVLQMFSGVYIGHVLRRYASMYWNLFASHRELSEKYTDLRFRVASDRMEKKSDLTRRVQGRNDQT